MDKLKNARAEISQIDRDMALLFEKRMEQSKIVAEYKAEKGLPIKDIKREKELLEKNRKFIKNKETEGYYLRFQQSVMDISCLYQERILKGMNVAYSGIKGAYSHIASEMLFPSSSKRSFSSFRNAFESVEKGETDCAVLPLENSVAGEVGQVMDLIFSGSLFINEIAEIPVIHCLCSLNNAEKKDIKTIVSHPQALEQCSEYIEKNNFSVISFSDTASAAEYVKNLGDISLASLSSKTAAELNGLKIIEEEVNDSPNNITRFASFSREKVLPSPDSRNRDENFILVFTAENQAGSLAGALNIIGAHGYNMRTLRSRPMKSLQWNYYFYIEAEGNINTQNGRDMMNELSAICEHLRLAGCYRRK